MAAHTEPSRAPIWTAVIYASVVVIGLVIEFVGVKRESSLLELVGGLAILGVALGRFWPSRG